MFRRGGKGLVLAGLFLCLVGGAVVAVGVAREDFPPTLMATAGGCLLPGILMVLMSHTVRFEATSKRVLINSGLRMAPKQTVHSWDEFRQVVAYEPRNFSEGASYTLNLRPKDGESFLLVQQYTHERDLIRDAKALGELMGLEAVRLRDTEYGELV